MSTQVRPGYKLTEVGVIPEDWDVTTIGQVVNDFRGGASLKPSEFSSSGVRVLPKGGVGYGGLLKVAEDDWQFCSQPYADKHVNNQVDKNYTIVVLRDLVPSGPSIGLTVRVIDSNRYVLAQGVYGFKVLSQKLDQGFLIQISNTSPYRKLMNSIMVGSTQVHITNTAYKLAPIPLPPLPEQRAIAAALADMDTLVSGIDQCIAKKRNIKQATMQQLLSGKKRLHGFGGKWVECTFGDVFSGFTSGATPYRGEPEFYGGDIRWITSGELNYGVIYDTDEKITLDAVAKTNLKILPVGTFLMAITGLEAAGTRGSCGVVGAPSATNQSCMAIFPTEKAIIEYLFHYYVLKGDSLAINYCQGTKQQSYTANIVKRLPISIPSSVEEQRAISAILSDMDSELATLEACRDKARQLKQGMMQELLTGRVRLL